MSPCYFLRHPQTGPLVIISIVTGMDNFVQQTSMRPYLDLNLQLHEHGASTLPLGYSAVFIWLFQKPNLELS